MVGNRANKADIVTLSKVTGDLCTGECGICDAVDDRSNSNDPAVGRIFPLSTSYAKFIKKS